MRSLRVFVCLCGVAMLSACAGSSQASPEAGEAVPFPEKTAVEARPPSHEGFEQWKAGFIREAEAEGIDAGLLAQVFDGMEPNDRVIELDRKQPEGTLSFAQYLSRTVNDTRIEQGRARMVKHRALLERIAKKYGVQARFIVALWGKETNYGGFTGNLSIPRSLATLAWEGRRRDFFKEELLAALRILQAGHVSPDAMQGSWAGAMGQTQFMPSSWWKFAVDEDGDGRKDIWNSLPDVFASIANYLKQTGWDDQQTWGREVRLPKGFDASLAGRDKSKPISQWQALGVRRGDGSDLPNVNLEAAIIYPDEDDRRQAYLVYNNYNTIMRWNRSLYFATAVGVLSDRLAH